MQGLRPPSYRFPKSLRLLVASDFNYLKKNSSVFKTPSMMVFYKPSQGGFPNSRLGLSVSKKVGKAHRRNRLKRILRECFRSSYLRDLGFDLLIVVSPHLDRRSANESDSDEQVRHSFSKLERFLKSS